MLTYDQIAELVSGFRDQWARGYQPSVRDVLAQVADDEKEPLLRLLVPIDLDWRKREALLRAKLDYDQAAPDSSQLIDALVAQHVHSPDPQEVTFRFGCLPQTVCEFESGVPEIQDPGGKGFPASSPLASPAQEAIGSKFADYELIEELGRGGMGVVFKAKQVELNRIIALKTILAPQLADSDLILRFKREAEAAAKLDHPAIVSVYDSGTFLDTHYFSMAYIDGGSLAERLRRGPIPLQQAVELLITVADAIAYAHQMGVVHRDLKPSNVLLNRQGRPLVADFGLAKIISLRSDATLSGRVLGTPSYMSPEQASGNMNAAGPHSDIYSLGAILYRMLIGRPPFQEDTASNTLRAVIDQEAVPPRKLRRGIPRDLDTICMKCLEKEISHRYQTATELKEDLQRFFNDEPIKAQPVNVLRAVWRWYTGRRDSSAMVAGGYAVIAGTILTLWNLVGLLAVSLQDSYDTVRSLALLEVSAGLIVQSIPTVALGWFTLRRRRWSLYAGTGMSIAAVVFAASLYVGQISLHSIQSKTYDAQSALLLIISTIATILYLIALYAQRKRDASARIETT